MVESNNLMPNIKRWSKQNAPNEAWAVATASLAVDMDADTGSGSGGGAIEARFKKLEEENAKARVVVNNIELLERTIKTYRERAPLHLFVVPNFLARKKWVDLVNRHFNFSGDKEVEIGRVRIMEMASPDLNEENTERVTGLNVRNVAEWNGADHQEAYQLFRNAGPFVTLLPKPQADLLDTDQRDETDTYTAANSRHHFTKQLLIITLSPNTPSLSYVPCSVVDLADDGAVQPVELDPESTPSILLIYWMSRRNHADALLDKLRTQMDISFVESVPHPDGRKVAFRLYMEGASDAYLNDAVQFINNPKAEKLFHAARWDKLHQDLDDAETRTLFCKMGHNPAQELLSFLDPEIQYVAITHGILRIYSKQSTVDLLQRMREFTREEKPLFKTTRSQRGDRATFQAINDGEGMHWVGAPPTPLVSRRANAWNGSLINGPIVTVKAKHRINCQADSSQ